MKIHRFVQSTYSRPHPQAAFVPHSCPDLATWQSIQGGGFCELPAGYEPCLDGFRPWRTADGRIIGINTDHEGR